MVIKNFSVGEALIEAIVEGSGNIIVLIAGLGGDASSYEQFTPMLNVAGYQTVAINLRGISGSTGPLKRLSLHDLAKDVAGVIDLLEDAPVNVIGRAFGNRVARCLARDRPDLVKTIILLAAGGLAKPDSEAMRQMFKLLQPNLPKDERLKAAQLSLFSPATSPDEILAALKNMKTWSKAAVAHSRATQHTPVEDWWSGGEAPMLVIQGLDDLIAPPANGRALRDDFGERVKLIELENAGHALIYEHTEVIAKEIVSFLQG
jgi:pimeloyl-ACP methyl ester carboxylesterase